jgi:hypothetical protein
MLVARFADDAMSSGTILAFARQLAERVQYFVEFDRVVTAVRLLREKEAAA